MTDQYDNYTDHRIKHLEMIQAVVSRLAGNAFLVKGWAVTIGGAFFGFAVSRNDSQLALVGLVPVALFWGLDAYFLHAERLFRELYERVRSCDESILPFFMGATGKNFVDQATKRHGEALTWQRTIWRPTLILFYGALLVAGGLSAILIASS